MWILMNGESSHIFPSYGMFAFVHAFVVSICLETNEIGSYLIQPKIEINSMISSSKLLLFCIMDWNYIVPSCISGSSFNIYDQYCLRWKLWHRVSCSVNFIIEKFSTTLYSNKQLKVVRMSIYKIKFGKTFLDTTRAS